MRSLFKPFSTVLLLITLVLSFHTSICCTSSFVKLDESQSATEPVQKIAYLTFDDGPSPLTAEFVAFLEKHQIPGNFFVIGENIDYHPKSWDILLTSGQTIMVHTHHHNYSIYQSKTSFFNDFDEAYALLTNKMGKPPINFMRFPGGSSSTQRNCSAGKAIRADLIKRNFHYIDWNIDLKDGLHRNTPVSNLLATFHKDYKGQERLIILMHDSRYTKTTLAALETIIPELQKDGYTFGDFSQISNEELETLIRLKLVDRYTSDEQS